MISFCFGIFPSQMVYDNWVMWSFELLPSFIRFLINKFFFKSEPDYILVTWFIDLIADLDGAWKHQIEIKNDKIEKANS